MKEILRIYYEYDFKQDYGSFTDYFNRFLNTNGDYQVINAFPISRMIEIRSGSFVQKININDIAFIVKQVVNK